MDVLASENIIQVYMRKKESRSYLRNVKIDGYKSFGCGDDSLNVYLNDINIIIGANGTGKSSFISFFSLLNNMMTGALQQYVAMNGTAEELLHFGARHTPVINAELTFCNDSNTDKYIFSLAKSIQDTLVITGEEIEWNARKIPLSGAGKESYLSSLTKNKDYEKVIKHILRNCQTYQFHDTSVTSRIRGTARIDNNKMLYSNGGNIAAYLYMLQKKDNHTFKYYERIQEKIRNMVSGFDRFALAPQTLNEQYIRLNWYEEGVLDYVLGPEQLSDGSLRFIALATLLLQPPELLPNVIILDEPELGLHPQAIDALAVMIKSASEHSQIIIGTQSARLIDSFSTEDILVAEKDEVSHCSRIHRLKEDDLTGWLKDYSLSQLWEKNVIGGQP